MHHARDRSVSAMPPGKTGASNDVLTTSATFASARSLVEGRGPDGCYMMSNGHSLEVTPFGDALRVSFNPGAALVLRQDGHGNFVSRDGRCALQFECDSAGLPGRLKVRLPPGGV